jgi:hypothetical protein
MSSSSTAVARELRTLFRHMRTLPSFKAPSSPLRKMVLDKVRTGAFTNTDKKSLRDAGRSFTLMTSSIKELNFLRDLDTGEKLSPRDKIRATAGRVGLGVPRVSVCVAYVCAGRCRCVLCKYVLDRF